MTLLHAGPWSGGVTYSEAVVKASISRGVTSATLLYSSSPGFENSIPSAPTSMWEDSEGKYEFRILNFELSNLLSSKQYFYKIVLDNQEQNYAIGRFSTFPEPSERADFKIGLASCSGNASLFNWRFPENEVFASIEREPQLLFFLHLGDFHYGNIRRAVIHKRLNKFDWMLRRGTVGSLFRSMPVAYCWDDHDFLGNDCDGGLPSELKAAKSAQDAYDIYVPHYRFVDRTTGIYQSFRVGRVLFLLTDNRFNKITKGVPEYSKTMLGAQQKAWLIDLLKTASTYDLVVWANSLPWVGNADADSAYWAAYHAERTEISSIIRDHNIRNLCMVCGDAHMLAIDDGTYSDFAPGGGGGFPLFHAAALESRPNKKGGMFSKGTRQGNPGKGIPGSGQYGIMEVRYPRDSNGKATDTPQITWTGKRLRRKGKGSIQTEILLTHDFTVPLPQRA